MNPDTFWRCFLDFDLGQGHAVVIFVGFMFTIHTLPIPAVAVNDPVILQEMKQ